MFSPWLSAVNSEKPHNNVTNFKVEKLDKIRLLPKAQQKLASSVHTSLNDLLVKDCSFIDNRPSWSLFGLDEYNVYIPKLQEKCQPNVLKCKKQNWSYDNSRCFSKKKLDQQRLVTLKEPISLTSSCRSMLEGCVKSQSCEFKPLEYPSTKPNALFYDTYDLIFCRNSFGNTDCKPRDENNAQMYMKWNHTSPLNPKHVLSESEENSKLESLLFGHEYLQTMPKFCLLGDYLKDEILLPTYLKNSSQSLYLENLLSRWNFQKALGWKIEKSYIFDIIDEPILELEMKYKLPLLSIAVMRTHPQLRKSFCKKMASKERIFSENETYMIDWASFSTLKLESGMAENETNTKLTISPMLLTNDNDRCLKLSDIENDCKAKSTTIHQSIPINLSQDFDETWKNNTHNVLGEEGGASLSHHSNSEDKTFLQVHCDTTVTDDEVQSSKIKFTDLPSTPKVVHVKPSEKSESASTKRMMSEVSSITLKKRKRENLTQFDFSKNYPDLDVLNQTTGSFYQLPEIVLPKTQATSRELMNKFRKQDFPPNVERAKILDYSEIDLDEAVLNIPPSQVCNVMLNVNFATKFGAAFRQFSNILENTNRVMLNEFKMNSSNLEYDMFLNASCGVIFVRPINIYQIDMHTGENLMFRQMFEIAMQVTSLIVVIAVDKTDRLKNDKKLLSFIKDAEDYGVQIFVVESDPKIIAVSMLELIQKYSAFDEKPFLWTAENKWLEDCGISNPFLAQLILDTWSFEDLVKQSEEERTGHLLRMCTDDLASHINRAVQKFTNVEF